jgi:lysophospholipase L1-like esterase
LQIERPALHRNTGKRTSTIGRKKQMPRIQRPARVAFLILSALLLALTAQYCTGHREARSLKGIVPPKITLSEAELKFEPEIARFEQMEKDSPSAGNGIVFTGSSSIRLWETLLPDMAPLEVVNRGFGGSIIRQVSYYADRILLPLHPRLIVIYCGENDICNEVTTYEEPLQNFKDFAAIIHFSLPRTRILYLSMKPSPLRWQYWEKYKNGNRLIEEYAKNEALIDYLDISAGMMGDNGKTRPEIWKSDSLHMNAIGYESWTSVVRPEVARIWKEIQQSTPDKRRHSAPGDDSRQK